VLRQKKQTFELSVLCEVRAEAEKQTLQLSILCGVHAEAEETDLLTECSLWGTC